MIYDVGIIGGGVAGSTLAALLRKKGRSVVVLEKEKFPRQRVGESFAHRMIGVMQESGSLEKVLASNVWIKKFGGYYAWDPKGPAAAFFDHHPYLEDGTLRWSMHVDRGSFDQILLDHAAELGAIVHEETQVKTVSIEDDRSVIHAQDGQEWTCRYVVEASGRGSRSFFEESPRTWLSSFKNVAIWSHFFNGKPAQGIKEDWNIFYEGDLSCVGSFAFDRGWCWYIPVHKFIDGEWREGHSIGIITSPEVLKDSKNELLKLDPFMNTLKGVPILDQLVSEIEPMTDEVLTATNYSMIQEQFCSYEDRWIRIGDSAYFVDPLFSSGVSFAMAHALSSSLLLDTALEGEVPVEEQKLLWTDYDASWHQIAHTFSAAIDQWYRAIGVAHPDSKYWAPYADNAHFDYLDTSFHMLIDTNIQLSPDLVQVVGNRSGIISEVANAQEIPEFAKLKPGIDFVESYDLRVGYTKGILAPWVDREDVQEFWVDPIKNGPKIADTDFGRTHYFVLGEQSVRARTSQEFYNQLKIGVHTTKLEPDQKEIVYRLSNASMLTTVPKN